MDRPLTLALEEKKIAGFDFTTSRYRPTPRRRSEFHIDATLSGSLTASVYGLRAKRYTSELEQRRFGYGEEFPRSELAYSRAPT